MSRRPPNPAADRAAQNQQTLKTLVKIESNKSCADCKRNKHPRWASWNLGIFICIRCSGIHRGMGTHISRVKSVDLDAWTDEQLQSMIRWGNARANKYWEAKLAPGHIPAEAKIENFIRTKYDTKRWVMDGGIPDPSTLDTNGGEQIQVEAAQTNPKVDRSGTIRTPPPGPQSTPAKPSQQHVDLFADEPSTNNLNQTLSTITSTKPTPPPKTEIPMPRQAKPADSLLGFDFFGTTQAAPPPRPSSAASSNVNSTLPSRPDLKQSILSLYASSSRTATPTLPQGSGAGLSSAQSASAIPPHQHSIPGGFDDAFSNLSFASTNPSVPPKAATYNSAASPPMQRLVSSQASAVHSNQPIARGNFFDAKSATNPILSPTTATHQQGSNSSSSGFGEFISVSPPGWRPPQAPVPTEPNILHDAAYTSLQSRHLPPPVAPISSIGSSSPFNLSSTSTQSQDKSDVQQKAVNNTTAKSPGLDAWGSSEVWASSSPATVPPRPPPKTSSTTAMSKDVWGWGEGGASNSNGRGFAGATAPVQSTQITRDEEFGGWETSAPHTYAGPQAKVSSAAGAKPGGGFGGGGEDLFSNVWE